MAWYSFDPIAPWYDRTRTLNRAAMRGAMRFLGSRLPPSLYPRALELGVGTGRIALPFSAAGYWVAGVDISRPMMMRLQRKAPRRAKGGVQLVRASVTRLPFRDASFDLAYWVHVLHLVPRWKRAVHEALRVVRPGGAIVALRTEGGRDIPGVTDFYRRSASARGFALPRVGVRRSETVLRYLSRKGCRVGRPWSGWSWTERVSPGEALRNLRRRSYSTLRHIPLASHRSLMRLTRGWAHARFRSLARRVKVSGKITLVVCRLPKRRSARASGRR